MFCHIRKLFASKNYKEKQIEWRMREKWGKTNERRKTCHFSCEQFFFAVVSKWKLCSFLLTSYFNKRNSQLICTAETLTSSFHSIASVSRPTFIITCADKFLTKCFHFVSLKLTQMDIVCVRPHPLKPLLEQMPPLITPHTATKSAATRKAASGRMRYR